MLNFCQMSLIWLIWQLELLHRSSLVILVNWIFYGNLSPIYDIGGLLEAHWAQFTKEGFPDEFEYTWLV